MEHLVQELERKLRGANTLITVMHQSQNQIRNEAQAAIQALCLAQNSAKKILINKPESFSGKPTESLYSLIGHMELYLSQVPYAQRMNVAISYLFNSAYDWYQLVTSGVSINR